MFVISLAAKFILFVRKVNNKLISIYQLSKIPHGRNCEIRGGGHHFRVTFPLEIVW